MTMMLRIASSLRMAATMTTLNSSADIGLRHAPDHNTLWRALKRIVGVTHSNRMLDLLARCVKRK